ncbi:hypothetical protein ANCCEY_01881 [Ancylostoma ceylanicum]|uniref:Uncharacterized protein n=1 Tax=Ancylostoma ceylanicum TaxID=53326 RepID=A0A0D6M4E6_9BILA|nr:hypothetical protein ANCCEY_01881 [Ancylostoma ceylanicum]
MLLGRTSSVSGSTSDGFTSFAQSKSLEDDARGGPPSVVDMEQLKEANKEDFSQTTRDMADRCLHAIGKSSRSGQWIPHEQTDNSSVPI